MTALVRSLLVMACVAQLSSHVSWAQDARFEGLAPGWGVPYNAGHMPPSNSSMPDHELLPDSRQPFYDFDEFIDLGLRDLVANTWIKTEYLNATFQRPGNTLLGADLPNVPNPREPFLIAVGALVDQRAIVPDTSGLRLKGKSGVRTTIGIEAFQDFSVVGSWVGVQDMHSFSRITPGGVDPIRFPQVFDPVRFPNNARFFGTSLTGSQLILYDKAFELDYRAKYWSGDVSVLFKYHVPSTGFRFQPLLGFRFNSYEEDLAQHGEFDNSSGVDPVLGILAVPTRNTILSSTQNKFYLGQLGFQAELVDERFTLGFSPKIGLGTNSVHTQVSTSDLRDSSIVDLADDGITNIQSGNVIFGSNLDLNAYAKIHLNEWLSLTGSAFLWYTPNMVRAHNSIVYDDQGILVPPTIHPRLRMSDMTIHGFTVGAEITF